MATETVETYDRKGNVVSTRQVTVPVETVNREAILSKARGALAANASYLALASPSAGQTTAQVKLLTRECNVLIRLLLSELQDVSDT